MNHSCTELQVLFMAYTCAYLLEKKSDLTMFEQVVFNDPLTTKFGITISIITPICHRGYIGVNITSKASPRGASSDLTPKQSEALAQKLRTFFSKFLFNFHSVV